MYTTKHALLETLSPLHSKVDQSPETVLLIQSMVPERYTALNGIEGCGGMKWGELRKWTDSPFNSFKLQASLLAILKRKDLLLLPMSKTMLEIQDYIIYNEEHPDQQIHFLKRFPPGEYEYTLVPTVYSDPIFARNTDGDIVEYAAPYFDTLVFKSDAHPWFVAAFARWQLYETGRGGSFLFENQFPIGDYHTSARSAQPLNFYCQPYLGWTPRAVPYHIEEKLSRKSSARTPSLTISSSSSSSTSSSEFVRPCKRAKHSTLSTSRIEIQQKRKVNDWRCHVVAADDVTIASDETLQAYAMEESRLVCDAIGRDPIYRRFVTRSKIATHPLSSRKRGRAH